MGSDLDLRGHLGQGARLAAVEAKLAKGVARLGWKKPADAVLVQPRELAGVAGKAVVTGSPRSLNIARTRP